MNESRKIGWSDEELVELYLSRTSTTIPERTRLLKTLKSFYGHFLKKRQKKRILELGCGDGTFFKALL